ncbi:MAG TPA: hypothetical protein VKQ52_11425 [Puia sp.]|nr:hypothetical protein [Puia sp.]
MKINSINAWPTTLPALPESTIATYGTKTRRNRPGVAKPFAPPAPPDEETIRRLNALAAKNPFCTPYKAKKHELL